MAQSQKITDTVRASKRTSSPELSFFTPSAESFNPKPYYPLSCNSVTHTYRTMYTRDTCPKPFDPTPDDPTAVFIHPPFNGFPDAHLHPEGLTYTLMAENPDWFLDPNDFKSEADPNPNAIVYPTCLEPPRGWCPTKKKDIKVKRLDGYFDEDTPMLRCTFCRRKYAGVNAKSMWRRHVLEKHKIPMSNRRDGPIDNGRSGRSANKENKKLLQPTMDYMTSLQRAKVDLSGDSTSSPISLLPPFGGVARNLRPAQSRLRELYPAGDNNASEPDISPVSTSSHHGDTVGPDHQESPQFQGLMLPPSSPPVNISSSLKSAPHASPFDPLKTPNIGHALRQPWKFPSPSHPLHVGPDELCLGVPVRGIAGEGLKGGYIPNHSSPFSLPHTSPTKLFSSPSVDASPLSRKIVTGRILGWKRSSSDSYKFSLPEIPSPKARRPPYTGPLPVPASERFEFEAPELLADQDDFDSSFSSLNDSFMSWIDMTSAFGTPSHDNAKIVESSSSSYPDTPIKRSSSTTSHAHAQQLALDSESILWAPQPSGFGLGISLPPSKSDTKQDVGDDLGALGEFIYPATTPADSPSTDDEWNDHRGPDVPPLKRRRTV